MAIQSWIFDCTSVDLAIDGYTEGITGCEQSLVVRISDSSSPYALSQIDNLQSASDTKVPRQVVGQFRTKVEAKHKLIGSGNDS